MKYLFFSLRPQQWTKNLFLFLPLIFAKKMLIFPVNIKVIAAFAIFSLAAGCVYLINDILDFKKDKAHPLKRLRPIPSGRIGRQTAWISAFILGAVSIFFSFKLNNSFGWILTAYMIFNLFYSKKLKEIVIVDIFSIGVFFLLRVVAGSIIAEAEMSHWIIFMTALLALFLGFNKRRQELRMLKRKAVFHRPVLVKYNSYFIDQMTAVTTSSLVIAYMLYTIDPHTISEFGKGLIITIPFVYYGIFRYLYIIHKLGKDGDPTRILFSDRPTQINLATWVITCIFVIYLKSV